MKRPLFVMKFGGTSLATARRIRRAAARVRAHYRAGRDVVVVVSAMGHTTDRLLTLLRASGAADDVSCGREVDRLLATGEDRSASLLAATLLAAGVPAVSLRGGEAGLIASGPHGSGELHALRDEPIRELLDDRCVPVIAGFQAVRLDGEVVTLGRGGSDTSAVFLAGKLGAHECHIITDVDGVYQLDPRTHPHAALLPHLSFQELICLVEAGACVVHPRAAHFARDFHVPLRVYSYRTPPGRASGSFVSAQPPRALEEAV